MKTNKNLLPLVNFLIFVTVVSLSTLVGKTSGELAYGVLLGVAAGLIGINAFYLYWERNLSQAKEKAAVRRVEANGEFKKAA